MLITETTSRYDLLKDKYKNIASLVDLRKEAINNITTLIKYEGVDDYIPPFQTSQWIQFHLLQQGVMALGKVEGELTFCRGGFGEGLSKRFGTPTHFIWYTNGGLSGEWEIGKDCVLFPANPAFYPDIFTIDKYCDMLNEVDKSINAMLIYTRDIPIPVVENDGQKKEVEGAIKDVRDGKIKSVKTYNVEGVKTLDITKPEMIQYMPNYSLLHDELMKRLYLHFGISIETKDKKAQLTTEELDTLSQVAGAAFYTRYELQKKAAEQANDLFGCNIEVLPGEYFDDLSNGKNEDFATDEEEPLEEKPEQAQEEEKQEGQNND